jgi:hypothetical protein
MWTGGGWDWVIAGALYAGGLGLFQLVSIRRAKRMGRRVGSSPSAPD